MGEVEPVDQVELVLDLPPHRRRCALGVAPARAVVDELAHSPLLDTQDPGRFLPGDDVVGANVRDLYIDEHDLGGAKDGDIVIAQRLLQAQFLTRVLTVVVLVLIGVADDLAIRALRWVSLAAILFSLGLAGIFLNRKNLIVLLMCIELMLLAVNMNFIAFSYFLGDTAGQVFVFFILTVAAAEAAIGLAILVVLFRNRRTINVDDLDTMKG